VAVRHVLEKTERKETFVITCCNRNGLRAPLRDISGLLSNFIKRRPR
jgi:hypothetical protein